MNPLITVYITTKNRLGLLKQAIASVEAQTWDNLEIIVVDDGSDDGTDEFLSGYKSDRLFRFHRNEVSEGAPAARNTAIAMASGTFLTGLDDDDLFLPNRLERLVQSWDGSFSALATESYLVSDSGKVRWRSPSVITHEDLLYRNLVGNQVFAPTELFRELGGFDTKLDAAQDYDLWLRITRKAGPIGVVNEPLDEIRIESGRDSITESNSAAIGYYQAYLKHKLYMTRSQRRYQLFVIRSAAGNSYSLCKALSHTPIRFWKKEIGKRLITG